MSEATKMIKSNAGEVIHLVGIMTKYSATCSLEFKSKKTLDPLIGISGARANAEYFEGSEEGDSVIINMGETDFSFDLKNHSFSKYINDCQIDICINEKDGEYAAWFSSSVIPPEGIKEATEYREHEEYYYAINLDEQEEVAVNFEKIATQMRDGWHICSVTKGGKIDENYLYIDRTRPGSDSPQ